MTALETKLFAYDDGGGVRTFLFSSEKFYEVTVLCIYSCFLNCSLTVVTPAVTFKRAELYCQSQR